MKKLFFCASLLFCAVSANAQGNTLTIYGKMESYTSTTKPDGSTTTELKCNNFFRDVCATVTSTAPVLTRGVSFNVTAFKDEAIYKSENFDNYQGIEERGDKIVISSGREIEN